LIRDGELIHLTEPKAPREGKAWTHDMIAPLPYLDGGINWSSLDSM
jgi:hypothetical protein